MLHFSHYNPVFLLCSQGENYLTDFWNSEGEMRVVPPEATNAPVQITVFVKWADLLLSTWIHHSSLKHISHWEAAVQPSLELLSTQLGIALWVHLGRLCVCLKMCCRSRGGYKCSLVNLQIFINLTLKSFVCCSLKKLSLVSSHSPCCLLLCIAQK